jgi:ribosomal protein L30/L7E
VLDLLVGTHGSNNGIDVEGGVCGQLELVDDLDIEAVAVDLGFEDDLLSEIGQEVGIALRGVGRPAGDRLSGEFEVLRPHLVLGVSPREVEDDTADTGIGSDVAFLAVEVSHTEGKGAEFGLGGEGLVVLRQRAISTDVPNGKVSRSLLGNETLDIDDQFGLIGAEEDGAHAVESLALNGRGRLVEVEETPAVGDDLQPIVSGLVALDTVDVTTIGDAN